MDPTKTIKILLVLPFFYPHRGGSQKYAEELYTTTMRNHNNISVDVLCYNTDKVQKYEEYRGFRIYRIPCFNLIPARFALPNPYYLLKALYILSKNKYDFVNTHIRFFDPTWWVWAYAKIIHAKSIFTGHVATHPVHQKKFVEIIAKIADLTIAKFSLNFYDYITFTNKSAQKFFKEKLGVSRQTYIVYGGVDTSFFIPSQDKNNRTIPKINKVIEPDKTIVTFVGRLIWTKGVTYMYDAIKSLEKSDPNNKNVYILAGPGELEDQLKKDIIADKLQDKVYLLGNITYEQVRDLLSITDIFLNPSHHNEGFPNTILEAGSSGCYVIATDNAGTNEVIRSGETGQLIPQRNTNAIKDSILWAFENAEKRSEIANNFRKELVDNFDWNNISEQYYNLLVKW